MKKILVLAIVLVAINQWDTNYNHGTLTRAGFSLARAMAKHSAYKNVAGENIRAGSMHAR